MSDNNPNSNPNDKGKGKQRASYPSQPPPSERPGQMPPPSRPARQSYPMPQGQPVINPQSGPNATQQQTGHPSNSPLGKRSTFYSYTAQQQRPNQPPVAPLQGRMNFNSQPGPDAPGKRPSHSEQQRPSHPSPSPLAGQPVTGLSPKMNVPQVQNAHPKRPSFRPEQRHGWESQPVRSPFQGQAGLNAGWQQGGNFSNPPPGRRPTLDQSGARPSQPSRGQPGLDAAAELRPFFNPHAMKQQTGNPRRPTFQPDPQGHEWPNHPLVSTQPGLGATQQQNAELATSHRSLDQRQGERGRFASGRQSAGSGESGQLDAGERMESVVAEGPEVERTNRNPDAEPAEQPDQAKKSQATQQALHLATTTYSQPPEQEHNTAGGMMDDMERYEEGERLMDEWKRSQGTCEYMMCRLPEGRHEDHCIGAGRKE